MTDIVERLRAEANSCRDVCNSLETASCMWTAADEIERLRAALRWIEDHSNDPGVVREARAALGVKP